MCQKWYSPCLLYTSIQVVQMVKTLAVPMPRTQKVPQTTQMVKNNILEIHQYGETDTPQNNQQRYIDEERIVPRHHQRITQISGQRGESRKMCIRDRYKPLPRRMV